MLPPLALPPNMVFTPPEILMICDCFEFKSVVGFPSKTNTREPNLRIHKIGSNIENWHSIIRQGLVVASGTNKQVNGAAYGKGIYLSPSVSVSSGYSRIGYGVYNPDMWKSTSRFLTSDRITCIALCEVITSPDLKKHGDIWVCPKDCHVCTRFFFVYEDGQVGDNAMHTQVQKYKEEISKAVGYHKHTVR
ncbi:protein mono-ADP-ribosyltransferase PARP6-like [Gigantopelta aegis]|uniref:protein mono-ADP-ribosyltransferase PARP6-like n=1 Tax=Gigantopelta aegis TaxID=1735272 RepID=UPI001B889FFE|nr:protein mono-ADP-ribosyltransferase PARP6-like [Gigantopelta aegis]